MELPFVPWSLSELASGIILAAAVLVAIGQLWQRFLGPFMARPIGKVIGRAIRLELRELVEEVITEANAASLQQQGKQQRDLNLLRRDLDSLTDRVTQHHRMPHPVPGGPPT